MGSFSKMDIVCSKNPQHEGYIPADTFEMSHLPSKHRKQWRLDTIKAMCDLTVNIKCRETSPHRQSLYGGVNVKNPIPAGKMWIGSGFVYRVDKCGQGSHVETDSPCRCPECVNSETPSPTWWKLCVHTACHIICDDVEARDASIQFFFDASSYFVDRSYRASSALSVDFKGDSSDILMYVHDPSVGERLERAWYQYRTLRRQYDSQASDLVVVVSHPHGCSKQVSMGKLLEESQASNGEGCRATYTAATCPGSGGGMVWAGRWDEVSSFGEGIFHTTYHHSLGFTECYWTVVP